MNNTPVDLGYGDLLLASLMVLISMGISWRMQLGLERDLIWGAVRSFVQLALVGFVLSWIFREGAWYWVLLALGIMLTVAVYTAKGRVPEPLQDKAWVFTLAIVSGSLVVLIYVVGAVLRLKTWYTPQYVLPLAGMIIGNSMTAATLAVSRFTSDLHTRRHEVETALVLGATSSQAIHNIRRDALRTAIIPSVNALLVVGVVSLPGMMTGQIIAGQPPTQAVHYQIMVMYMITAAATITAIIGVVTAANRSFTAAQQLQIIEKG